jgi:hypothetical protein
MAKLAGVTQISEATLSALNTQLLAELKIINDSKMAEKDKEAARDIAFGKYNAAITKAGELAAKESYSERVQIQLTEIARLASLSNTTNAALTLTKLRESAELSMIDRVAKAQADADAARLKALQEYIRMLESVSAAKSLSQMGSPQLIPANTTNFTKSNPIIAALAAQVDLSDDIAQESFLSGIAGGADIGSAVRGANYAAQAAAMYQITINAGAIASQDEFAGLIQDTIQRLNRGGDPLTTAGVL